MRWQEQQEYKQDCWLEGEIKGIISNKTVELTGNISKDRWGEQLKTCGETIKSLFPSLTHRNCSRTHKGQQKYAWITESTKVKHHIKW